VFWRIALLLSTTKRKPRNQGEKVELTAGCLLGLLFALTMEAVSFSETPINFYHIKRQKS
jgi:hypothetical protein